MKFARNVQFQIKEGKELEFSRVFDTEVLPLLKKQKGFEQEITLVNKDGARGISLWTDRTSAEAYHATTYNKVLDKLNPLLSKRPLVVMYDVANSTLPV